MHTAPNKQDSQLPTCVAASLTKTANAALYLHAQVFNDERHRLDVYGQDVEVDYRGYEVTVENFMRVLTGARSHTLFECHSSCRPRRRQRQRQRQQLPRVPPAAAAPLKM